MGLTPPTSSTTAALTTTSAPTTSSTPFLALTSTQTSGVVAGTCPQPGFGLPLHVSDCFCAFAGVDGAGCSNFPDDGSACWCKCCCHFKGGCSYKLLDENADLTQVSYIASLVGVGVGGCLGGMLVVLCFRCCHGAPKRE